MTQFHVWYTNPRTHSLARLCCAVCVRAAALPDVLERCCDVGRLWFAADGHRCSVYPSSVPGVAAADRGACAAVVDLCCTRQRRDRQCAFGKQTARRRSTCRSLASRPGSEQARVCPVRLLSTTTTTTTLLQPFNGLFSRTTDPGGMQG